MKPGPDAWASEAAALPLAFAQVREDPLLDLELAKQLPASGQVIMVASGGDTAVCLARLPLGRLLLVDVNPAQLALTRCRLRLAATVDPATSLALLGHAPMPAAARGLAWDKLLAELQLPGDIFGPRRWIAQQGPDGAGRYEVAFAELRRQLEPWGEAVEAFLRQENPAEASRSIAPGTALGAALEAAFARVLRLENLVALFGEGATRNPRQPFHQHFLEQLRDIAARLPPAENPWLWQLLAGRYPVAFPAEWLRGQAPLQTVPDYRLAPMREVLDQARPGEADLIHLSNILDWLSPAEARATLAAAWRALRPGGHVLLRQLNSTLEIPALFPDFRWDAAVGRRLQRADRSFFYREIHLGARR